MDRTFQCICIQGQHLMAGRVFSVHPVSDQMHYYLYHSSVQTYNKKCSCPKTTCFTSAVNWILCVPVTLIHFQMLPASTRFSYGYSRTEKLSEKIWRETFEKIRKDWRSPKCLQKRWSGALKKTTRALLLMFYTV